MPEGGFRDLTERLPAATVQRSLISSIFAQPHLSAPLRKLLRPEQCLQIEIIRQMRPLLLERGVLLLSIGNEIPASGGFIAAWQAIRTAMGAIPGAPDLVLLWPDGGGFVELKRSRDDSQLPLGKFAPKPARGELSTPQRQFRDVCQAKGIRWACCRSVAEFEATVRDWGLL